MVSLPNFVIGGAPKCGTTSLANYLRMHREVFFSDVKEPFYFAVDLPAMRQSTRYDSESRYLSLFGGVQEHHQAIGEGSTLYLYSKVAIEEALRFNPNMKFIFMLRRPSEIAHAYHMQMVSHEFEDVVDFEQAWRLWPERKDQQVGLPIRCRQPELIDYRSVASIGTQIKRAFALIPPSNLLVIPFDRFVSHTRDTYLEALKFLGVEDDGRTDFPKENSAMQSRAKSVTRLLRSGPVRSASLFLKRRLGGNLYSFARNSKHALMFQRKARMSLTDQFDAELHDSFRCEVELVEHVLGWDLKHWKVPKPKESLNEDS